MYQRLIKVANKRLIQHTLNGDRVHKRVYFYSLFPSFSNINETVAKITSIKMATCFSWTIATTRIAAAHMIEFEINSFFFILSRRS